MLHKNLQDDASKPVQPLYSDEGYLQVYILVEWGYKLQSNCYTTKRVSSKALLALIT